MDLVYRVLVSMDLVPGSWVLYLGPGGPGSCTWVLEVLDGLIWPWMASYGPGWPHMARYGPILTFDLYLTLF